MEGHTEVDPGTDSPDPSIANLYKIDQIVVLMMENRSFDHMLGYLKQDGMPEVEGLTEEHGNQHEGEFVPVWPLHEQAFDLKALDPGHGFKDVKAQLEGGNQGFVKNFVESFERLRIKHPPPADFEFDPTLVLGYQTAETVPVYDWIARNHVICDHWFSSVPGPTWENRLYAITGGIAPKAPPDLPGDLEEPLEDLPIYDKPAFTRWLADDAWRWYSHDPATLRAIDSRYRPGGDEGVGSDDNFAYFNRRTLLESRTFLDDAMEGKLPKVSWIDPNFVDLRLFGPPGSNDDHPPSRVMLGQELVLTVLQAVMSRKQWENTLLVITYDEHGGMYDHVVPGGFPIPGDESKSYGVRVPALVVSPWAEQQVCHTPFDHTSLLKTILLRFADDPAAALEQMGPRTQHARHLGEALTASRPRAAASPEDLLPVVDAVTRWKQKAYEGQLLEKPSFPEKAFDVLTDLQGDIVKLARWLRGKRLPPGKP